MNKDTIVKFLLLWIRIYSKSDALEFTIVTFVFVQEIQFSRVDVNIVKAVDENVSN